MSEITYKYNNTNDVVNKVYDIRWLTVDDYDIFSEHLLLCGQRTLCKSIWNDIYRQGGKYSGMFIDNKMVARVCVEKYSETAWEVGDVRTANNFRNRGYAYQLCLFVLEYIRGEKMIATMRTEEDNYTMQKIINRLGFVRL